MPTTQIVGCRISVPTFRHVTSSSWDGEVSPPSLSLAFVSAAPSEHAPDSYFLTVPEAGRLVEWLRTASEDVSAGGSWKAASRVRRTTHRSINALAAHRLSLYGIEPPERGDDEGPTTVVDVATPPGARASLVRLTFDCDVKSYWLSAARARELANGLITAVDYLRSHPPQLGVDVVLGEVAAMTTARQATLVEVKVEGSLYAPDAPRVCLNIGNRILRSPVVVGAGGSWWLLNSEVDRFAAFLRMAADQTDLDGAVEVGQLHDHPDRPPWLTVEIQPASEVGSPHPPLVRLFFDDPLVRESGSDGALLLARPAARHLADLLCTALEAIARHPPVTFEPGKPREVVVADLRWE